MVSVPPQPRYMPLIGKKLEVVEETGSAHDPNELPEIIRPTNREIIIDPLATRNVRTSVASNLVSMSATPAAIIRPNSRMAVAVSPLMTSQT